MGIELSIGKGGIPHITRGPFDNKALKGASCESLKAVLLLCHTLVGLQAGGVILMKSQTLPRYGL
jgi:hypothetical protein